MKNNWKKVKFDNIAELIKEKFDPKNEDNQPYIGLEHIQEKTGEITGKGQSNLTLSQKNIFHKKNVLFGKLRPYLRKYWLSDFDGVCSTEIMVFRPKNNIDPRFIFYTVQRDDFIQHSISKSFGTKMPRTDWHIIKNFSFSLPSNEEIIKISKIFSTLDQKIEKTDQIIQKTESLKRGLMGELLTKGIGHKKFKKSKLGEVPDEWEIRKLSDIAKVERGKFSHRPRNDPRFYDGLIPFIQTGDVVSSKGRIKSFSQTLNDQGLGVSKRFPKGTIVLTIAANIGDTGILEFDACFPDSLVGIQPYTGINSVYLEYFLRSRKEYLNSIATQSAQKNINLAKLNPLPIALPSLIEQNKIAEILSSIDDKITLSLKNKENMQVLKNGLMHDIFSQKVQIN